jgi:hypothetical protein
MRISVSVTPAAWAGIDANNNAAKKADSSHFIFVFINAASNAKLTGARDAYPAITIIAPKTGLLKSNIVASSPHERSDMRELQPKNPGYRFAHPGYSRFAHLRS